MNRLLVYLLLALHVAAVLSLPVWPSQDGPLHVYFSSVFTALASNPDAYGGVFVIKHWFPPYSILLYLDAALTHLAGPLHAEQVVVCLYAILLLAGFRYLTAASGRRNQLATLLVFPFLLNAHVYIGLLNFALGTAFLLWTLGYWIRHAGAFAPRHLPVFALLVLVLLASHPVPLLFAALFVGLHTALLVLTRLRSVAPASVLKACGPTLVAAAMPVVALAHVWLFAGSGGLRGPVLDPRYATAQLLDLMHLRMIMPLANPLIWIVMAVSLLAAILLAGARLLGRWRERRLDAASLVPAAALLAFVIYLIAPYQMGSGLQFDERFAYFAAFLLLAAAAATLIPQRIEAPAAILVTAASLAVLFTGIQAARPQATAIRQIARAPGLRPDSRGLILAGNRQDVFPPGFHYTPCQWGGTYYFQAQHAILLNTPLLDLEHIPLGRGHTTGQQAAARPPITAAVRSQLTGPPPPEIDVLLEPVCGTAGQSAPEIEALARWYGLERQPWSNQAIAFYSKPPR